MLRYIVFLFFFSSCFALYSSSDDVIELTPQNFEKLVLKSDEMWIVEFYAPWCGHCKALSSEYIQLAAALKGIVKIGAVNADEHKTLGSKYGIKGFPSIKWFGLNKQKPVDYEGERNANGFIKFALDKIGAIISKRLGKPRSDEAKPKKGKTNSNTDPKTAVITLTQDNFEDKVLNSDETWLVEFFAPWCGHCKNLAPHWASASLQLEGKVFLGAVDATVHTGLAQRYGIQGYPTIKVFKSGEKNRPTDYPGGRTSNDIVGWVLKEFGSGTLSVHEPQITQLLSQSDLQEYCEDTTLCMLVFLPHILDSQAAGRNDYIQLLHTIAEKYNKPINYLWSEGGIQDELENLLGIGGYGYPAVGVINYRKMRFAQLTGPYTEEGLSHFINKLIAGTLRTSEIKSLPVIKDTEKWDGKDAELPVEIDYDLDEDDL